MNFRKKILKPVAIGVIALMSLGLVGCGQQTSASNLANLRYHSGRSAIVKVHHDRAQLSTRWTYDHVHYANLDHENRTSKGNTGWLDKNNIANDKLRTRQIVKPTGWHQKFDKNDQAIINRGHEIAYSLSKGISQSGKYNPSAESGDQNNPKNLFTQTAFSNQELQTIYESKVRNALRQGDKVIYQVKPVFKGNDKMANGVHMQAISTNRRLDFNVYLYNVQPGYKFNYRNGTSVVDHFMRVPTPANAPHFNDNNNNSRRGRYHSYGYGYGYHHSYYGYHRHHHFLRHYAEYRLAKHVIRHHYYAHRYGSYYHPEHHYMMHHYGGFHHSFHSRRL